MPVEVTASRKLPLKIWDRLEIIVGEGEMEGVYTSRLEDIGGGRLVIGRPVFRHGKSLLAAGRWVTVTYTRADAAYQFAARLIEAEPRSRDSVWLVDLGNIKRAQRRRFVRVELALKVNYNSIKTPLTEPVEVDVDTMPVATTINLSAGGILIPTESIIERGTYLLLHFKTPGKLHFSELILGVCRRRSSAGYDQHVAGIEFILAEDMSQHFSLEEIKRLPQEVKQFSAWTQNELVSGLFNEEIILRQKGLI
jgi:c-di-GMP-binding flagellar brake protein YcgR